MDLSFLYDTDFEQLPVGVVRKAKILIREAISWICLGARSHVSPGILAILPGPSAEQNCSVIGTHLSSDVFGAAFANAAHAQVHDCNDGRLHAGLVGGAYHPGRVIIPAAFSLCEYNNVSGRKFITSVVIAYEVAARIVSKAHRTPAESMAVAAMASIILDLSPEQTRTAMILSHQHSPLIEPGIVNKDTDANFLSNGYIAKIGVESAVIARHGLTAPEITDDITINAPFPDGSNVSEYKILDIYIKPYPTCRGTHPAIDAALALRKREGFDWHKIKDIHVYIPSESIVQKFVSPQSYFKACQFSLPYAVACAFVDGEVDEKQFTHDHISSEKVHQLQRRIHIHVTPELRERHPDDARPTLTEVIMQSGEILRKEIIYPLGSQKNPLGDEALRSKWYRWAGNSFSLVRKDLIYEMVEKIDEIDNMRDLSQLLLSDV